MTNKNNEIEKEFNLSEKIKNLFEIEYLDTMADVQGDVTILLKEFIRLLKEELCFMKNSTSKDFCNDCLCCKDINKLAGKFLI